MSARVGLGLLGVLFFTSLALADTAELKWIMNTEIDLGGYRIYKQDSACPVTATLPGPPLADVGKATTFIDVVPQGVLTRCYATTAYDLTGNESGQSVKVSKTFAQTPLVVPPSEPVLSLGPAAATSLTVLFPVIPDGAGGVAKIDLRYAPDLPGDLDWGSAASAFCTASPCTITGLLPSAPYELRAVAYRGELNMGTAVFSTITPPLIGSTLAIVVEPPTIPVEEVFTNVTNVNGVLTFQFKPTVCTGKGGTSKSTSAINATTGKKTVTLKCLK